MELIIINEPLKIPIKGFCSRISYEEFGELFMAMKESTVWSYNFNNPEHRPGYERGHLAFLTCFDKEDEVPHVSYHSITPGIGSLIAVPERNDVKITFVYGLEDYWENEVCQYCFSELYGCCEEGEEQSNHVRNLLNMFPIISHDPSRDSEFSTQSCDCCGSKLGGQRHFLICLKDT